MFKKFINKILEIRSARINYELALQLHRTEYRTMSFNEVLELVESHSK